MSIVSIASRRRALMAESKSNIAYEAYNIVTDGTNYIDTGVKLFSAENINKDFEVSLIGLYGATATDSGNQTIVCAKYDSTGAGFLIRVRNYTGTALTGTFIIKTGTNSTVIFRRINGIITVEGTVLNPNNTIVNDIFDHPLVIGCALRDNGTPYRFYAGSLEHIIIKWI